MDQVKDIMWRIWGTPLCRFWSGNRPGSMIRDIYVQVRRWIPCTCGLLSSAFTYVPSCKNHNCMISTRHFYAEYIVKVAQSQTCRMQRCRTSWPPRDRVPRGSTGMRNGWCEADSFPMYLHRSICKRQLADTVQN